MALIQPARGDSYVNRMLTNVSIAYMQDEADFVAHRVFPMVPVDLPTGGYWIYDREDFNRDQMEERTPGEESVGGGFTRSKDLYDCTVWALHKNIDDQIRASTDTPLNADMDATEWLTHQGMIRREREWASSYLVDGVWTFSVDGAAARSASLNLEQAANNDLLWWNDDMSDPIKDVRLMKRTVKRRTGRMPNVLTLGRDVYDVLLDHAKIIDRLDAGQTPGGPAMTTRQSLAALFEVEELLVMDAIYNSAEVGADESSDFIGGKNGLLSYRPPRAGLRVPSAGYTFPWNGYLGSAGTGMRIKRFRMEQNAADRIEIEMAFDMKVVGADLGVFIDDIVQ